MLLCQEQGGEQAQQGLIPKAHPAERHWILQVNQVGGKAFGSGPNQAKPGAPASWGLPAPSTTLLLTTWHELQVRNLCFPVFLSKDNHLQYAQLGRGLQLTSATPYFASSRLRLSPIASQRLFFPQWDAPEESVRAARLCWLLCVGQEQCPAPRALNA